MATLAQIRVQNESFCDMLDSDGFRKQAEAEASDYVRLKLREEGFSRKIIEPQDVTAGDIVPQLWTDKPVLIFSKETDIQPAVQVGYAANPIGFYIRQSKFAVTPTMIITPQVQKHKWELRSYKFDVRQVFADNIVKDMGAREDQGLLATTNVILIGANSVVPASGVAQYKTISGGFSRSSVVEACDKVLQATPFNIPVETCLVNNLTWADHRKWRRDEAGGDISEKFLTQGWTQTDLLGKNWLITIKRGLVPTLTQYLFGPAKFLGKCCLFTPPTMVVQVEPVGMYKFFAYEEIGTTIAHAGAVGRVDYQA